MSRQGWTLAGFDFRRWGSTKLGLVRYSINVGDGLSWTHWGLLLGPCCFSIHPPGPVAKWLVGLEGEL